MVGIIFAVVGVNVFSHLRFLAAILAKLAKRLFFSGNIIIVDHGTGIFSNYAHLSRIDVEPGQHIEKGQPVGLSGATGRVSGPHLHWGIKVNGIYIDPLQFVDVLAAISGT